MNIEDIKANARRALHEHMGRPALYFADGADPESYVVTKARPFSKRGQIGDLPGTNLNYAEVIDRAERVLFWRAEVPTPVRGALVIMTLAGVKTGFFVDSVDPPDGLSVTAQVTMATAAEIAGFPAPEDV